MKYIRIIIYTIITATLLGLAACEDERLFSSRTSDEGEERMVSLSLTVSDSFGSQGATRSTSTGVINENTVKDIWIIEYDTDGNRIGFPRYYDSDNLSSVRLIVPTSNDHSFTGVILANTHNNNLFDQENDQSLSEDRLKLMYDEIREESEVYTTLTKDGVTEHYLPMSCTFDINKGGNSTNDAGLPEFKCELKRNVAKVVLTLKTKNLSLDSLVVRNVPEKRYIAERLYHDSNIKAETFDKIYDSPMEPDVTVLDWDMEVFSAEQKATAAAQNGLTLVYYLPRSCWGKAGTATNAKDKNWDAPEKATYFEILASRQNNGGGLRYKIYPGMDVKSDFNIMGNCCYTLTVTLDPTNITNDSRVEDLNQVRLTESNSYIINPGVVTYEVPISRINTFWSNDTQDSNHANYVLKDDDEWIAEVIWQDKDEQMIEFCNSTDDEGVTYSGKGQTTFHFRTKEGDHEGNIVIGVRRKTGSTPDLKDREYLWSWHLWLTSYSPDQQTHAWTEDKYEYEVTGGAVHRYEGSYWQTVFHNKYMMDRNLGARTADPGSSSDPELKATFGLYYQYGRFAPFPYYHDSNDLPVYDIKGEQIKNNTSNTNLFKKEFAATHAEAVRKPHYFFNCSNSKITLPGSTDQVNIRRWIGNEKTHLNPYERNIWDDPDWHTDSKSIFDPCPPGWEVPDYGVYESFASFEVSYRDNSNIVKSYFKTNSVEANDISGSGKDKIKGYHFYLNPNAPEKGTAWFPLAGCKNSLGTGMYKGPSASYNNSLEGEYWMSVPINSDYCNRMDMTRAGIQLQPSFDRGSRSAGSSVRCIRQ